MSNNIKTYISNSFNPSISIGPTGLTGYKGCLYYISGAGGVNGDGFITYGGSAGYVNSGYIDFDHPYTVSRVELTSSLHGPTSLLVYFTGPKYDPTNGTYPIKIAADPGKTQYNDPVDSNPGYIYTTKYINQIGENVIINGYFQGQFNYKPEYPTINGNSFSVMDQRNNMYNMYIGPTGATGATGATGYNSTGNLTSQFGNTGNSIPGGAGFYGANGDSGINGGYSSGTIPGHINYGYGIVSLIPRSIVNESFFIEGDTGITGSSEIILYNLLGGGGGGGVWSTYGPNGNSYGTGGGGGGSGDWISGLLSTKNINLQIGLGGTGGSNNNVTYVDGSNGGNTILSYGNSRSITAFGGKGGGTQGTGLFGPPHNGATQNGSGGAGYFAGGGGVGGLKGTNPFIYSYGGWSYTNIVNYMAESGQSVNGYNPAGKGRGTVSTNNSNKNYGAAAPSNPGGVGEEFDSAGGGGGGFWAGSGTFDGNNLPSTIDGMNGSYDSKADGYGCGGGGGSCIAGQYGISGGNGTQGYAIVNYLNTSPYVKIFKITSPIYFNATYLASLTGFWFFLSGDGASNAFGGGKNYHNTGHFLIKEDGVRYVNFTINNGYFNINVGFNKINSIQQVFNLNANSQQNYAMIMFYV